MNTRHAENRNPAARARTDIPELVSSLASKDGMTRQHAREQLSRIGRPAVKALIRALDDHREQVRWEAAKTLGVIADNRAAPALVRHLEDGDFDVRWLAAEALVALREDSLPPLLEQLELYPERIRLREGAHHVLTHITNQRLAVILRPVVTALDKLEPELTLPVAARAARLALQS
jgi:HEAT repeat protein